MTVPIAIKYASGRSKSLTAERLVNMYAEKASEGAVSPVVLHGVPGRTLMAQLGEIRGLHTMGRKLYAVAGGSLFCVSITGAATSLGDIAGSGPVTMADNGSQLCIVAEPKGYIFEAELEEITDEDFPGASSVDFLDGYFIFSEPDSGRFFNSTLYAGEEYDALDFATAESSPDDLVRVFVDHREIWLFGEDTCEIWTNQGLADFPFARYEGAINEKGMIAPFSAAKVDNSVFWVDRDGVVRRAAEGYRPVRISTHEVENQISKGNLQAATAYTYVQEGHEFYSLTVPGASTFVFDAATQMWHERDWGVIGHARAYGKHYVGVGDSIYSLDLDTYTDVAEIVFPPINMDGERFTLNSLQLDMEEGTGEGTAMLSTSNDGKTWSNESWRDFSLGEYNRRMLWKRMGRHRDLHIRFRISSNVQKAAYAAYANIS